MGSHASGHLQGGRGSEALPLGGTWPFYFDKGSQSNLDAASPPMVLAIVHV